MWRLCELLSKDCAKSGHVHTKFVLPFSDMYFYYFACCLTVFCKDFFIRRFCNFYLFQGAASFDIGSFAIVLVLQFTAVFKFMNTFQTEVVAESRAMVPDCRNRLKKAVQDLDILLVSLSKQIRSFLKIQITISIELIKECGLFCPWDFVVFIDCSFLSLVRYHSPW